MCYRHIQACWREKKKETCGRPARGGGREARRLISSADVTRAKNWVRCICKHTLDTAPFNATFGRVTSLPVCVHVVCVHVCVCAISELGVVEKEVVFLCVHVCVIRISEVGVVEKKVVFLCVHLCACVLLEL